MARGRTAPEGSTNIARNGYHYTKVGDKWRLTHHLVAEKKLGRPLREDETVRFVDGDKTNLSPSNVKVLKKRTSSLRSQLARINARIEELSLQRDEIVRQLKAGGNF